MLFSEEDLNKVANKINQKLKVHTIVNTNYDNYSVSFVKDIDCVDVNVCAGAFYGLPEQPIKKIEIENVNFHYSKNPHADIPAMMSFIEPMKNRGFILMNVDEVIIKNVHVDDCVKEVFECTNVNKLIRI